MCFSTGDLVKVIDIELQSVCCEDISNNEKFELPISYTGWSEIYQNDIFAFFSTSLTCLFSRLVQSGPGGDAVHVCQGDDEPEASGAGLQPSLHFHQSL